MKSCDGYSWKGHSLQVQKAKESFLQKTAKLRAEKVADVKEAAKEEFKPLFVAKKFEQSSDSSDSSSESEEEEEKPVSKTEKLQQASQLLEKQLSAAKSEKTLKKEAEKRRLEAAKSRQDRDFKVKTRNRFQNPNYRFFMKYISCNFYFLYFLFYLCFR